ncbi:MAG: hypothetical protein K2R98_09580 [Gemmataceae bacterium]|nr:hypothetical protein [Gemmataceae bacterium]
MTQPVVLELAPLPREQLGPFVVLGVDKDANRETIEASWAQRVIAARKNQLKVSLEDVNWAREVINDPDRRLRADATSLNPDTADHTLRQLAERFGISGNTVVPRWQPFDEEKALADYAPNVEVPAIDDVRQTIAVPEVPLELPAVAWLVEQFVKEPLDPWNLSLTPEPIKDSAP